MHLVTYESSAVGRGSWGLPRAFGSPAFCFGWTALPLARGGILAELRSYRAEGSVAPGLDAQGVAGNPVARVSKSLKEIGSGLHLCNAFEGYGG